MRAAILGAVLAVAAAASAGQAATCGGGTALPDHAGKRIALAQDTLFFAVRGLQLDHDGSPEAYGVRDQGLENICNGLGPLQPANCRGQNRGPCFPVCQAAFAAWSRSGRGPEALRETMCSIGLGGGGCSPPAARLQAAPRQEWFVSETSVRVSPPAGPPTAAWLASQDAQLDPARVPYFVIPGGFRRLPWDATPGDAGVVLDTATGRRAAFVVGDIGGALDEASSAVHVALRGGASPPVGGRRSALGEQVRSFLGGTSGDFRVAVFRHTSTRLPGSTTLSLTAADLGPWIERTAAERLAAIGGEARVRDCARP